MFKNTSSLIKALSLLFLFVYLTLPVLAQNTEIISKCGGNFFVSSPSFTDNDQDGLSDTLEQILLNRFIPTFIQFSDDGCPGPSSGISDPTDSNLVVCRIFPLMQQYAANSDVSLIQSIPSALINEKCLNAGLVWYDNQIVIYGAILYGKDCGLPGHTADVEGFSVSLRYIGNDDDVSWRYDTTLNNWEGMSIQTISHAGTLCQHVETFPYRSTQFPTGKDTIFSSPDKHGNYLTKSDCNSNPVCNPGCNTTPSVKNIKIINAGEEVAPMLTDLGVYYSGYAGENPWSDSSFLSGEAGKIKSKLLNSWRSDFIQGQTINSCNDICMIYNNCYNCDSTVYITCINDCQNISFNQTGCNSPAFNCPLSVYNQPDTNNEIKIFPNPSKSEINIIIPTNKVGSNVMLKNISGQIIKQEVYYTPKIIWNIPEIPAGMYFLQIEGDDFYYYGKQIILN